MPIRLSEGPSGFRKVDENVSGKENRAFDFLHFSKIARYLQNAGCVRGAWTVPGSLSIHPGGKAWGLAAQLF
jgi:hypothetical protein